MDHRRNKVLARERASSLAGALRRDTNGEGSVEPGSETNKRPAMRGGKS